MLSNSKHILIRIFAMAMLGLLLQTGCQSSVMTFAPKKNDLSRYDMMADELSSDPVIRVDQQGLLLRADELEQQEQSLATLTPEMIGEKIKLLYLKLVHLDPNEEAAITAFAQGVELFDAGKFMEAEKKFYIADMRWPGSPLQEDAIYMRAESAFFAQRYAIAQKRYERLLKKFSSTRYLDYVSPRLFAIGEYWDIKDQADRRTINFTDKTRPWVDTTGNCITAFKTIALHDSRGKWADHALMAAGNAEYIRGRYVHASQFYDQLVRDYPQSIHVVQAYDLNLSAKLLMYEGPKYDGKPLEDAEEIAERLMQQFNQRLAADRKKEIVQAQNAIVEMKAERDLVFAKFYESKRFYGAASYYYLLVINDYPGSKAAAQAKERHNVIKDYRPEPPDHFAWLKEVFPER